MANTNDSPSTELGNAENFGTANSGMESQVQTSSEGHRADIEQSSNTIGLGESQRDNHEEDDAASTGIREENYKAQVQASNASLTFEEKLNGAQEYVEAARAEGILAVNGFYLQKTYPKAYAALTGNMAKRARIGLDEETTIATLIYAPTLTLYHFFDASGIFVNIVGSDESWENVINGVSSEANFASRVEAEYDAFEKAFETLEKQL